MLSRLSFRPETASVDADVMSRLPETESWCSSREASPSTWTVSVPPARCSLLMEKFSVTESSEPLPSRRVAVPSTVCPVASGRSRVSVKAMVPANPASESERVTEPADRMSSVPEPVMYAPVPVRICSMSLIRMLPSLSATPFVNRLVPVFLRSRAPCPVLSIASEAVAFPFSRSVPSVSTVPLRTIEAALISLTAPLLRRVAPALSVKEVPVSVMLPVRPKTTPSLSSSVPPYTVVFPRKLL